MNINDLEPKALKAALDAGLDVNHGDPEPLIVQAVRAFNAPLVDVLIAAGANTLQRNADGETAWSLVSAWTGRGEAKWEVFRALCNGALTVTCDVLTPGVLSGLERGRWTVPSEASRGAHEADVPLGPVPLLLSQLEHPTETFRWYDPPTAPHPSPVEMDWTFDLMREEYPEFTVTIDGRPNANLGIIGCHSPTPGLLLMDVVASAMTADPTVYRFDASRPTLDIGPTAERLSDVLDQLTAAPAGADWPLDLR